MKTTLNSNDMDWYNEGTTLTSHVMDLYNEGVRLASELRTRSPAIADSGLCQLKSLYEDFVRSNRKRDDTKSDLNVYKSMYESYRKVLAPMLDGSEKSRVDAMCAKTVNYNGRQMNVYDAMQNLQYCIQTVDELRRKIDCYVSEIVAKAKLIRDCHKVIKDQYEGKGVQAENKPETPAVTVGIFFRFGEDE